MRKCLSCNITFDDENLVGCLYCESILVKIHQDQSREDVAPSAQGTESLPSKKILTHQNKDYLMGILFRRRTFLSSFAFSCNDIKRSKKATRFLVQPIDIGYVVKIPWLVVDIVYSLFFHILHSRYCPLCNTRYFIFYHFQEAQHPKDACEYCQEYNRISDEIFLKKERVDLRVLRKESEEKVRRGKKSAFFDLTHRNIKLERFLDILSILISIALYGYVVIRVSMPIFAEIYQF
ncbi:MAG: hypothetical protein PHY73_04785 [Candidatus Omnitrophica bacterium]|nr:hypothetical protein [Candidatus Omnitrophota bacterium]